MSAPMPQSPAPAPASSGLDELSAKATQTADAMEATDWSHPCIGNNMMLRTAVSILRSVGALAALPDQTARERVVEDALDTLDRIAKANPFNTNSDTAQKMASWTHVVASCALDRIRAALAAERSGAPASEWRPISTCPAATLVLLWSPAWTNICVGRPSSCHGHQPTHWMPLPPPPSPSSTAGGRS